MPLDQPDYPGEQRIPLSAEIVSSARVDHPEFAIGDDPATFADFGPYNLYDLLRPNGSCGNVTRGVLRLTDAVDVQQGSIFTNDRLPITSFRCEFTIRIYGGEGICFVVQGVQPDIVAGPGAGMGYTGIGSSIAVKFDPFKNAGEAQANTTGLFTGGAAPLGGAFVDQVDFDSGNPLRGIVTYDGTTLTVSIQDMETLRRDLRTYTVDIPAAVGASDAFIGFTATCGSGTPVGIQQVWDWAYQAGTDPEIVLFGLLPRFIRAVWGDDRFITRVRLALTGDGAENGAVAFESSLGFLEVGNPPPEVPIPYIPLQDDGDIHTLIIDPPLLAKGVIFYPDFLLSAADLAAGVTPDVRLSQLQVYEIHSEGVAPMSLPTVKRSRVGVQAVSLYPHTGVTGPYDNTTACDLAALQELGLTIASKSAMVKGGETVHTLGAFETDRETKIKFSGAKSDLRVLNILLGGTYVVDPAAGGLGEVQYFTENLGDRAPYFRLKAKSTNGDGADSFVYPKLRVDGNVSFNLQKDQVTNLEFEAIVVWDDTYVRQDGNTGGIFEQLFGEKGETAMHS